MDEKAENDIRYFCKVRLGKEFAEFICRLRRKLGEAGTWDIKNRDVWFMILGVFLTITARGIGMATTLQVMIAGLLLQMAMFILFNLFWFKWIKVPMKRSFLREPFGIKLEEGGR